MEIHKKIVRDLGLFRTENSKFDTLNGVFTKPLLENIRTFKNDNNKLCVVYSVWGNFGYVKFLYFSILSQLTNTDILNFDLRIFVSADMYGIVVNMLKPIISEDKIIRVPVGMSYKYGVANNTELKKYETIVFSDVDAVIFSMNNNTYSKIYNFHKKNKNTVISLKQFHNSRTAYDVFLRRKPKYVSKEEYWEMFQTHLKEGMYRVEHYLNYMKWNWSGHISYNNSMLDDNFAKLSFEALYKDAGCDETIFFLYFVSKGYNIVTANFSNSYEPYIANEYHSVMKEGNFKRDMFVHPASYGVSDPYAKTLYKKIIDDYFRLY